MLQQCSHVPGSPWQHGGSMLSPSVNVSRGMFPWSRRTRQPTQSVFLAHHKGPVFPQQILPNSTALFVKLGEIPQHYYLQIPYIPWLVGVVPGINWQHFKVYIVTCNTKTHYIRPLVMKIHGIIRNYRKGKLKMTSFCCFINGKIKKEPEKLWIRYRCSKNGQFCVFLRQAANFAANSEFHGAAWKFTCV